MRKLSFALVLLVVAMTSKITAQELPFKDCIDAPLEDFNSSVLTTQLYNQIAKDPTMKRLVDQKKMAVGIVSLDDPNAIQYAGLNGEEMMYAASLPKIAILLSAMDAIEKGELKETAEVKKDIAVNKTIIFLVFISFPFPLFFVFISIIFSSFFN